MKNTKLHHDCSCNEKGIAYSSKMRYQYSAHWVLPEIASTTDMQLCMPHKCKYGASFDQSPNLKASESKSDLYTPERILNLDLKQVDKQDSSQNKKQESTDVTPLLKSKHEAVIDSKEPKPYTGKATVKRTAEKRPRSRAYNNEVKSPVKPTKNEIISPIKTESKEEEKEINPNSGKSSKGLLCLRKDVVYKTLIRSLKRYLTDKCNLEIDSFWNKKEKEIAFFDQIDILFKSLYLSKFDKNESNRDVKVIVHDRNLMRVDKSNVFNPENIKIYLCLLVIPEIIKPYLKNQKRRCQQKLIYDCLYKYSHK